VTVGPRKHHPSLYVGVVGRTSDAKGDGWAVSLWPFREAEPEWASVCIANGVGSGEGLIERIADPQMDKDGVAQGAPDKRCLLRLSELSRCFKIGRRENSTLSEHLREGWDGEPIHLPNRKRTGNALSATDYAVSMVGDITPGMIRKLMAQGTEGFDGFANRFLWAAVKSDTDISDGGSMKPLRPYLDRLASALAFAKQAGEVKRDAEAHALWDEVYPALKRSGDTVPHTDRARPYALRLSMLYALADKSAVIRAEHLRAALALWEYCRASAMLIFGSGQGPTPGPKPEDPLWPCLLNAISNAPGISRTGLREKVGHKVKAEDIDAALARLERSGLAYHKMVQAEGGGRPAECWYPVLGPVGDGDGESNQDDNPFSPLAEMASAGNMGREGTNSPESREQRGEETPGRELTPQAQGELVSSLPPLPEAQAQAPVEGVGADGVVNQKPAAFAYEPQGGFGKASGEPKPSTTEPMAVLYHGSNEARRAWFRADSPPAVPDSSDADADTYIDENDFMRRLDSEPDAVRDGAFSQDDG